MPSFGIVIVNYNSADDTQLCVQSIEQHTPDTLAEIIIVDNASPDHSGRLLRQRLPQCRVILSDENNGYAAGVNLGAAHLKTDYILILNPDSEFVDSSIDDAVALLADHPRLGLLGLKLVYPDGTPQYSARRFYSVTTALGRRTVLGRTSLGQRLEAEHLMKDQWRAPFFFADWVLGTGMLARTTAFRSVGGMDEHFFLYLEDTDLCARMWLAGWEIAATPLARLAHKHRRASKRSLFSPAHREHLNSFIKYTRKYPMPILGHGTLHAPLWDKTMRAAGRVA